MKNLHWITLCLTYLVVAMDDKDLYHQLEHIIYNGTLTDFEQQEPTFRAQLSAHTIGVAQHTWCRCHLHALEEIQTIQADPELEKAMLTMQQNVQSLKTSLSEKEFNQQYKMLLEEMSSADTYHQKKVMHILEHIHTAFESPFGKSMKVILEHLKNAPNSKQYLAHEQHKVTTIQKVLQQILDDEFGPEGEPRYDEKFDRCVFKGRQRKNQTL